MKTIELPSLQGTWSFDDLVGRWNVTCGYNCIDFNWHFLAPFSALWAEPFLDIEESIQFQEDAKLIKSFFNKSFLPGLMDCHNESISDLRHKSETGLVAVPGDNAIEIVGIIYKVDNNGDTIFCYKEGHQAVTDSIIRNINGSIPASVLGSLHVKKSASS